MTEEHKKNLLMVADYIENLDESKFDMNFFRSDEDEDNEIDTECNTVGCIIGHATRFLPEDKIFRRLNGNIDFDLVSEILFGIGRLSNEWSYLFSASWDRTDNTTKGAAARMRYFVENGLPDTWENEIYGLCELSYKV